MLITITLGLFLVTLYVMGRTPLCSCGFGIWTSSPASNETSQLIADPYTFSHILHGIIFFAILFVVFRKLSFEWKLLITVLIEVGWEILENSSFIIDRYRAQTASLDYYGDSILNSFSDVAFCALGFWVASKLPWKWTLVFVIAVELIMLALIRDNLTLNIIMLVYPIEAIKQWQLR